MSGTKYQQEFNKQLSKSLQKVRKHQPNHIPVYSMKYKTASKYLIEDLKQSLALFPKQFKLKKIHDIISQQSLEYCKQKLKNDIKVKDKGENFQLPKFHLYTIQMISDKSKDENQQLHQESNMISDSKKQKPIGKFVKLNLEMTFEQSFNKYGRENVLTIVYTDAEEVRAKYTKTQKTVEKWLQGILVIVLVLIIIPYLMKSQSKDEVKIESNNQPNIKVTVSTLNTNTTYNDHIESDIDTLSHTNHTFTIDQHTHDNYYDDNQAI